MNYVGRPGISPALAALLALGRVRKKDRILDVGCANGTDALLLARWGFRSIDGIDPDARAIRVARARATRARLSRRVRFHHVGAESLSEVFTPRSFDVLLHTLVANNLTKDKDKHFKELAAVARPDALLVLHERVTTRNENSKPDGFPALRPLTRHFDLGPGIATHLAEHAAGRKGPSYARVVLWIGTPRR